MHQKRIETKISRTAELCCLCRAVSALEKDPLFRSGDRIAVSILPDFMRALVRIPGAGRLLVRAITARGIYEYIIARTKYIDAAFRVALAGGVDQILIIGAGYDTRAVRFREESGRTKFFELDAPITLQSKIDQYRQRRIATPPNLVFVPINFDKESIPEKLAQARFRRGVKTLFLIEGVLEYLQPESVDRTFRTIRDVAGAGSEIVFNYAYASVIRGEGQLYGEKGALQTLSSVGEAWHFGIEKGAIGSFLAKYGCEILDHRDTRELEELFFKDPSGRIVARINGTHCLVRAGIASPLRIA
ncbi:MAG: SAM-dependent methyltransferase [Anaerolineales bacterium]|nr:SAM-dependent methyltransferase [Anaerolineales bacterium]